MKTITLTVQSNGTGEWRLGLNKDDSIKYFSHRESVCFVLTNKLIISCKTACGTSEKKAYDFNNKKLSNWIVENSFHKYQHRKPTKLIFEYTILENEKRLTFENIEILS